MDDDDLRQLLKDTLRNNRAFAAGVVFGVPEEAHDEHLKAVIDGLLPVVKALMANEDGGLEYARMYGTYPDGSRLN